MRRLLPFALAMLLTAGCAQWFEYEMYEKNLHEERGVEEGNPGEATVDSFESLKRAILRMVRGGVEEGSLRAVGYQGDFARDLDIALKEVRTIEPLGAYAVDYMSSELPPVLPQNTAELYISYRQTAADIAAVRQAVGKTELRRFLQEARDDYRRTLVVELGYYDPAEHNIQALLETDYYDRPEKALGMPGCTVNLYPADAEDYLPRILEINLDYWDNPERLAEMEAECEAQLEALLSGMPPELTPPEMALWLHDALGERITYDETTVISDAFAGMLSRSPSYTLYGALSEHFAVSEGYALAYKLACDRLGIECMIVIKGRRSNYDHIWNLVRLDGGWYHVDAAADDSGPAPSYDAFLLDDESMGLLYTWGGAAYPAAPKGELSYAVVAGIVPPDGEEFPSEVSPGTEDRED